MWCMSIWQCNELPVLFKMHFKCHKYKHTYGYGVWVTWVRVSLWAQPIWRVHSMAVRQVARETRHGVGWGRLAHCDWLPSVGYFSRLRETKGMSKAKKQTTEPETTKHCSRKARTTFSHFYSTREYVVVYWFC